MQVEFEGFPEIGLRGQGERFGTVGKGTAWEDELCRQMQAKMMMKRINALPKDTEREHCYD